MIDNGGASWSSGSISEPPDMPDRPGAELAATLEGMEPARLSGDGCVDLLRAEYRQGNHRRARLLAVVAETLTRTHPGPVGHQCPDAQRSDDRRAGDVADEFAADEVRAALGLTRSASEGLCELANRLVWMLPEVWQAMAAGWLDEPRARVLAEETALLTDEQARSTCHGLLGALGERMLSTSQLRRRARRVVIATDPESARRRYEQALAGQRVYGELTPSGTANLSGLDLPASRAAAACARIDQFADRAARGGDPRPIQHLRAEIYLGLLDGSIAGDDEQAIVEYLRRTRPATPEAPAAETPAPEAPAAEPAAPEAPAAEPSEQTGSPRRHGRNQGIVLRVRLTTLLGLDRLPGELVGWGPLGADQARALTDQLSGPGNRWSIAFGDARNQLHSCWPLRARPAGVGLGSADDALIVEGETFEPLLKDARGAVQLIVGISEFVEITERVPGRWLPVLSEISRCAAEAEPAPGNEADRRLPSALLRRHVQVRDRTCRFPFCAAPAHTGDVDHTHEHARGGSTTEGNLGSCCRHDHRLKGEGGWELTQPEPGVFRWRSRLGQIYWSHPPPLIEPLDGVVTDHEPDHEAGCAGETGSEPPTPPSSGRPLRPAIDPGPSWAPPPGRHRGEGRSWPEHPPF